MEEKRNPTQEELNTLYEHLWPTDYEKMLEEIKEIHGIEIKENFLDIPINDPRWYSLE